MASTPSSIISKSSLMLMLVEVLVLLLVMHATISVEGQVLQADESGANVDLGSVSVGVALERQANTSDTCDRDCSTARSNCRGEGCVETFNACLDQCDAARPSPCMDDCDNEMLSCFGRCDQNQTDPRTSVPEDCKDRCVSTSGDCFNRCDATQPGLLDTILV